MQALALVALQDWDLAVANLAPIKVRENAVFRIDLAGGARAVLRVHRSGYHSDSELDSEFVWMRALEEAGIAVPRAIRSRHDRDFEIVAIPGSGGTRQIDVFEWIEGRQLGSVESGVGTDGAEIAEQYHMIGRIAARMHNHAAGWQRPTMGFRRHAWDAAGLVGEQPLWGRFWELAALTPGQRSCSLRHARARIARELAAYGTRPDRYGLIHADLVPENLLIDGNRIQVIDFDDAGFGWHLFELATSLYFIAGDEIYPTAREALISGYRTERELPDEALARLPLFLAARGTTYLGWVHTRQGSETARELTPLFGGACLLARSPRKVLRGGQEFLKIFQENHDMSHYVLMIDGKAVATTKTFNVLNPADETVVAACPEATTALVDEAVRAARRAGPSWAALPDSERAAKLLAVADLIEKHHTELSELVTREQGKTQSGPGANLELGGAVAWTRVTAGLSLPEETIQDDKSGRIVLHRKPVGVVASITPWNWPMLIAVWHIMPAIRVGCTVVIKPSPFTPLSTLRLVELMNQILPPGVVNTVTGGFEVGNHLTNHPGIDKIVFTGSIATGQEGDG